MKKLLTLAIIGFLCFSMFSMLAPQAMGWSSPLPLNHHGDMTRDALEGKELEWTDEEIRRIPEYASEEDYTLFYHRVGKYQKIFLSYKDENYIPDRGAENGASYHIRKARQFYVAGNTAEGKRHLGYAIHFIQDAVCPPHVFPFREDPIWWLPVPPSLHFEINTALEYGLSSWRSLVRNVPIEPITDPEDLRNKVVEAADWVYTLPSSYVRQDKEKVGDPPGYGWYMSSTNIGSCMERAASLVKGAAIWAHAFAFQAYHSYAEIESGLRSLESSGIAKVESIGVSVEGRQIWAIKISDDPNTEDEDEPDVLFAGLHHAREWISAEVPYYLAVNLVQNYDTDSTVKTLVDNSEIWIVPVLNPDGLEYSRTDDRDWRKNRRDNGDGTFGVDLNRNYGYMWGLDSGSSGVTSAPDYRGPHAFSEPETIAMRDLISDPDRDFQVVLSYHSYSQLILYPWGYTHESAPASSIMSTLAAEMSDLILNVHGETYAPQQSSQLYLTSGDLTDWVYGTMGVSAFTIELRPESFDPEFELPASEILDTCEENWPAALYLIRWVVLSQGGFMDFEDGVDEVPIRSTIPGMTFTTTMGYDWIYGDIRTGKYNVNPYGTRYYECHGNLFAWLGPNQGNGRIDFVGATARSISTLTSTHYGTYLEAYDSSGNLIASDYASPNTQTGTMSEIAVTASSIAYVIVHDTGNYWLIDDLRVRDLLRETNAFQPPDSTSMFQTLDTINKGAMSTYEFANDQQQTLKILLNWQGSQLGIQVFRPDGTIFYETESDSPPIRIVIPAAEAGTWRITVNAIDVPFDDYPFAIDVASIPPPPDIDPPAITVETPLEGQALQDGVTFRALVSDPSGVDWVTFSIREPDGEQGTIIDPMFESMPATYSGDDEWQLPFDTTQLPDGYYLLLVKASDMLGNEGNVTAQFSIRNWACIELLPASEPNKARRTMPVKFSLRIVEAVDPAQPFVWNEELTIKIYEKADPENILLQTSTYGIEARDYRIDPVDELYITNFRTLKTPKTYVVEIYRKDMLIGSFEFSTVK